MPCDEIIITMVMFVTSVAVYMPLLTLDVRVKRPKIVIQVNIRIGGSKLPEL